jgi:hypothetical protein
MLFDLVGILFDLEGPSSYLLGDEGEIRKLDVDHIPVCAPVGGAPAHTWFFRTAIIVCI